MDFALYVTTGADGIDHSGEYEQNWNLPTPDSDNWLPGATTSVAHGVLVLRGIDPLLEVLDEQIYLVEPIDGEALGGANQLEVAAARLLAGTKWNLDGAAHFALDCVEHGLLDADAAGIELPHGGTLGEVIADARAFIDGASEQAERRLSVLARLAAARRLRRSAGQIGELAFATLREDLAYELDATDDPAWATIAAFADATIACVEALRHLALPRYVAARENTIEGRGGSTEPIRPTLFTTPWGPVMIGGEYRSPFVPTAVAAREAALRTREAVADRHGAVAMNDERTWQAARLAALL